MATFWEKKMRTYFSRIDLNADGQISKEDFTDMADRFIKDGFVAEAKKASFSSNICGIWDKYLSTLGETGITQDAFVESIKKLIKDPAGVDTLKGSLVNFFHAVDTDGDEQISKTEFELFYRIIGLEPSMAAASFATIDENSDDQLSLEEFTDTGILFFTSEDESHPSKVFWGPLIG